ncbi:MAG: repressor LexA [Planctomycetales bacterium 4484_113]|nr:MAG: repressor LexA [Planctomycetales bacterium 4484_113]
MGKTPTKKQKQVLRYISQFFREYNYAPSVRDIARMHDCSVKGAYDHILALEKKGLIERFPRKSRAMIVTPAGRELLKSPAERRIPLVGRIAAGKPLWAEENFEDFLDFPLEQWERNNYRYFALTIVGDSMKDAGILDGDLGIFRYQRTAEPGQIVVALVEDEATVKFYHRRGKRVVLRAANPAYPDVILSHVTIQGVLRGLVRPHIKG